MRPLLLALLLAAPSFADQGGGGSSSSGSLAASSAAGGSAGASPSSSGQTSASQDLRNKVFDDWRNESGSKGGDFVDAVQARSKDWRDPFAQKDCDRFAQWRHSDKVEDVRGEMKTLAGLQPGTDKWRRELSKVMRDGNELLDQSQQLGRNSKGLGEMMDAIKQVADEKEAQIRQSFPSASPAAGGSSGSSFSGLSGLWGGFDAQNAILSGAQSLNNNDLAGVQRNAAAAIAADPTNPNAYLLSAVAAAQGQDYAAAANAAQAALDIDPSNKQAQTILGLTENRTTGGGDAGPGAGAQAAAGAGAAAQGSGGASAGASAVLVPSGPGPRGGFGDEDVASQLKLRDYKSAETAATSVLAANPNDARAYYLRSVARLGLTNFPGALQDANSGLALDSKSNPLLDAKADALNRLAMYKDALGASSASLELDPKDAPAYYNRGISFFGLRDRNASVDALRQAAAIDPAYQPVADKAASAPSDADLSFLLPDGGAAAAAAPASPAQKARRFGVVAVSSLLGGLLIALGLLQFLMEPVKSAFTKITRRASSFGKTVSISPLARDGSPGLLRGQYQVVRQIGSGGMGVVYEGRDVSLERKVAVKRMREELKRDPRERQRFLSEAKLVAALHHPNIVDIYAIVEEGDDVYLVFEHIAGRTVHEILAANGRLSFDYAMGVLRGVASALDFAHARGIIHRDLKPSNVMVDEEGRPRVMDFGIARAAKDALTRQVMTNTVVGTPPYMAPEQEQGVVRRESDIYALGVCLYEMLSGRLPFAGTGAGMLLNKVNNAFSPLSQITSALPPGLDAVIAKSLDPDPAKRFSSAKQLVDALEALRAGSAPRAA